MTTDDATTLVGNKKIVVVGVFKEFSGEAYDNFSALVEKLGSDYEFGHTRDAKLLPRGDSSVSGPVVRLFKPFDELFVDIEDFHVDALKKFVEEASLPVVIEFNNDPTNHPFVIKFFNSPNEKAMLFLNFSDESFDAFKSTYREVAEKYKKEGISFLIGDLEASQGAFQDGKVSPYKKSEPIPEQNNEPVKVVVADSIQDYIKSGKNDTARSLLLFWMKLLPRMKRIPMSLLQNLTPLQMMCLVTLMSNTTQLCTLRRRVERSCRMMRKIELRKPSLLSLKRTGTKLRNKQSRRSKNPEKMSSK